MLEESVTSVDDIKQLAGQRYRIGAVHAVTPAGGGASRCYRIDADKGSYLLKEFPARYTLKHLVAEPGILRFLDERNIPVVRLLRTTAAECVWIHNGHAFHLQKFVEGQRFGAHAAPPWLLPKSAKWLARIHTSLREFPELDTSFHDAWFRWDPLDAQRQYRVLINRAHRVAHERLRDRIMDDLDYKAGLVERAASVLIEPGRLTRCNSHGDYYPGQFICGPDTVRAIVDFSDACRLPVVWEIVRSYSLGAAASSDGQLDVDGLKHYVQVYLAHGGELSEYDLEVMPHLFFLQLARSAYGYEEYLTGAGYRPDAAVPLESLLSFGFWRTRMCRWMEQSADYLSRELRCMAR